MALKLVALPFIVSEGNRHKIEDTDVNPAHVSRINAGAPIMGGPGLSGDTAWVAMVDGSSWRVALSRETTRRRLVANLLGDGDRDA